MPVFCYSSRFTFNYVRLGACNRLTLESFCYLQLLTRLAFERGNADAASKVAEIMGEDLVHQVITACVPPVYPPKGGKGWACIPRLRSCTVQSTGTLFSSPITSSNIRDDKTELYMLRRDVVKHLATPSPVRAVLACVFGGSRFKVHVREDEASFFLLAQSQQQLDDDQWFYEFALEQSER
jgi:zinc finger FYVE domain-containing protein 26